LARSPAVILYDLNGVAMAVSDGVAIPASTEALLAAGSDGTNAHYLLVDASGSPVVVGAGVAGTPAGGVVSIQGVAGGTAIPISGTVSATNPSVGTNNAAVPGSSTQVGGTDGTNLQSVHVFDADSGGGTQFVLGVGLRKSASGGSVEAGTSSDPLRVDPTGTTTQPISAASLPLPAGASTAANQTTLGNQTTKINDGTNTATVKAASTAAVASDTAIVVAISPNNSITASNPSVGTNASAIPSSSTQVGGSDGTNLQAARVFDADTGGGTQYVLGAVLRKSASGGSVEAGTSSDPLRIDPTGTTTQPISAASLPLPSGASTSSNQTTLGSQTTKINDGTNTAAVKAASTAAVATDPALVVAISPNNPISVSGTADATGTGALGALNAAVQVTTAGLSSVGFQLAAGTLVGTIIPEVSYDGGTTWVSTFMSDPTTDAKSSSVVFGASNTATARSIVGVAGSGLTRIRVSAYTSGTANITLRASMMDGAELQRNTSSGAGYTVLTSPNALPLGISGQVTSYGTLKVTTEGSELFVEPFDGTTIDTTDRWNQTIVGGATISQSSGTMTISTSTTASNAGALSSKNSFRPVGLGFQIYGNSLKLEAVALTNNHRFWGLGTQPGSWTASTPIQDGVGFEQDTTGALNAVTYSSGTRSIAAVLDRPSDGNFHRYAMYIRADLVYWYFDTLEVPVASASWPALGAQTLPIRIHSINHTSGPASGPTFQTVGIGITETSHSGVQISDGQFAWRKSAVKAPYMSANGNDGALTVSVSPNSLVSNASRTQILVDTGPGLSGQPNRWVWVNMLSSTMDIASAAGANVAINTVSSLTSNGSYGSVISVRSIPPLDSPLTATFVVKASTASANSFISFGLGNPTFILPTTLSPVGAYFVINGTTSSLTTRVVGPSFSGVTTSSTLVSALDTTAYYTYRISIINRSQIRFLVELGTTLVSDTTVSLPSTEPYIAVGGTVTLYAFVHVYNDAAVGTAPVVRLSSTVIEYNDSAKGKTLAEQRAGTGMVAHLIPYSHTGNTAVAESAPGGGVPSNSSALYSTLGGEYLATVATSSETIRGIFGYLVPIGQTLYITNITLPQYSVSTTLGSTLSIHDWFINFNTLSSAFSSSVGSRIALGTFSAASSAAAGTIFNGSALVYNFPTPLVVQGGKYVVLAVKYRSSPNTGAIRGCCQINGYYE
jgi:hypothetical protein